MDLAKTSFPAQSEQMSISQGKQVYLAKIYPLCKSNNFISTPKKPSSPLWYLTPLISRIYESLLTYSELQSGNSAAHEFKRQTLVAPRGRKIFVMCFLGYEYFAQRFYRSLQKNGQKHLGRCFGYPYHFFGRCSAT